MSGGKEAERQGGNEAKRNKGKKFAIDPKGDKYQNRVKSYQR